MKNEIYLSLVFLAVLAGCAGKDSTIGSGFKTAAGNVVGNGGNVVLCPGKRLVMLDVWELEQLLHGKPSLGDDQMGYLQKASLAVERLSQLDNERTRFYGERIKSFENESAFLPGAELTPIPDSLQVALPANCSLKQLAIQQQQYTDKDPRYVINKDLWDQLDSDNQAALVLHEIIYREAIQYRGHQDSLRVRKFNAYLLSRDGFTGYDGEKYRELLARLKLPYWIRNVPVKPQTVVTENGHVGSAETVESDAWVKVGSNRIFLGKNRTVKFYPSGMIRRGSAGWTVETGEKPMVTIGHSSVEFANEAFAEFYENGSIRAIDLGPGVSFPVQGLNPLFYSTGEDDMTVFYPSGDLKEATLAAAITLRNTQGKQKEYAAKARVSFDEHGLVID